MGVIQVPNLIVSVWTAAAARIVNPSAFGEPVVSQAAAMPRSSKFLMVSKTWLASPPIAPTPNIFSSITSPDLGLAHHSLIAMG